MFDEKKALETFTEEVKLHSDGEGKAIVAKKIIC